MEALKISGVIKHIRQEEKKGYRTAFVTVVDNSRPQYPEYFEVEFFGSKEPEANSLKEGDVVSIMANLKGNEWIKEGVFQRCFLKLSAWKIESHTPNQFSQPQEPQSNQNYPTQQQQQPQGYGATPIPSTTMPDFNDDIEDDIPF